MNFDQIAARFDGLKRRGNEFVARCPVPSHGNGRGDRNPSLSITDADDKALVTCHVGCSIDEIVGAVGLNLADLFYDQSPFVNGSHAPKRARPLRIDPDALAARLEFIDEKPKPLPEMSVAALPLDAELIPEPLRDWIVDIADRMQCPVDYPACAAIVAAAAVVGNKVAIRPKINDSWLVVPNLFGAVVGLPGSMKSPAVNEALRPIYEIAKSERAEHEIALSAYAVEKELADADKRRTKESYAKGKIERDEFASALRSHEIEPPTERRVFTSDATVEKLGELLNQNPYGILMLRDELTGFLRGLDRAGHEQDRAFYLEAWNGSGSFSFDRIARGTVHIKNLTLSIFGSIQPAMIGPYLRSVSEEEGADGLMQRFQLLVYPKPPKTYRYIDRRPLDAETATAIYRRLWELDPNKLNLRMQGEQAFVSFDSSAQAFFEEWFTDLETSLRSGEVEDPAVLSHLAKYRSLMPSLALIFHLIDAGGGGVSLDCAMRSAAWCGYLKSHAEKLYSLRGTVFDTARLILKRIEKGDIKERFASRDVYRQGWSGLTRSEDVNAALSVLVDYGYIAPAVIETPGRTATQFVVHPSLIREMSNA